MSKIIYYYLVFLTCLGVFMHVLGTLGIYQTQMPKGIHMLIYAVGILAVIGLMSKSTWGYFLNISLYFVLTLLEAYLGYQSFYQGQFLGLFIICPLVTLAFIFLIINHKFFTQS